MPSYLTQILAAERSRRAQASTWDPVRALSPIPPQLKVFKDGSRKVVVCTSRRAGKTFGIPWKLIDTALIYDNVRVVYITQTRLTAKELIWDDLKRLVGEYQLKCEVNNQDLTIRFANGSKIIVTGAKDETEALKLLGLVRIALAVIDEAQSIRESVLRTLVFRVIEPGLADVDGQLMMTGTPGPAPVGMFYEATQNAMLSRHYWTMAENPFPVSPKKFPSYEAYVAFVAAERHVPVDDPSIQREFYGRWIRDENALVFRWSPANEWGGDLPVEINGHTIRWQYVMGIDVGFEDADAIAMIAWSDMIRDVYLVEEYVKAKTTITDLENEIRARYERYRPSRIWMDCGGIAKKVSAELLYRLPGIPIEAAEKTRKNEYIEILNDMLRSGRFHARADSAFAEDCQKIQWDMDQRAKGNAVVSRAYHSDIADSVIYGVRSVLNYLAKEPEPAKTSEQLQEEELARNRRERETRAQKAWYEQIKRKKFRYG